MSFCGQPVSGKTAKGIRFSNVSASNSIVDDNIVDHNSSYGIYVPGSTGILVTATSFANAFSYQRAASGIRLYSSTRQHRLRQLSARQRGLRASRSTQSNNNLVVNNVTYNNGDHGIDNTDGSTGQPDHRATPSTRTSPPASTSRARRPGVTIANNITVDNGIASPRTHSNIRVESGSTAGTTLDYDLLYLTVPGHARDLELGRLHLARGASGRRPGRRRRASRPTRGSRTSAGGDFHLLAGSPAIDSANSGASGQPASDLENHERVDDPRRRTPARLACVRRPRRVRVPAEHRSHRDQPGERDHGGRGLSDVHGSRDSTPLVARSAT